MKGMTSASFTYTAPRAVISNSISTGSYTPNYYSNNSTELFTKNRISGFFCRRIRTKFTLLFRCDRQRGCTWSVQRQLFGSGAAWVGTAMEFLNSYYGGEV